MFYGKEEKIIKAVNVTVSVKMSRPELILSPKDDIGAESLILVDVAVLRLA